jgi:hypothetical protein
VTTICYMLQRYYMQCYENGITIGNAYTISIANIKNK